MMNEKKLEKEQALLCYMNYLKNGYLSKRQREAIEIFDRKQKEFELVAFRLEAIERVKLEQRDNSLNQYEKLLKKMYNNYKNLSALLDAEYSKMSEVEKKEKNDYEKYKESKEFEIE